MEKKSRELLAPHVEEELMDYILHTPVKIGEKLPNEFELAELFGVGRSTVRETVKSLVSKGVLEGVFTADPRKIPEARKLKEITYDEMLELATLGAQVLNNRSVEMAKKYNVEIEVLSSLKRVPGTIVKEVAKMEKMLVRGVTKDTDVARISVTNIDNTPGIAFKLFSKLAQKGINVDIILQSVGRDGTKDITFTVAKDNAVDAIAAVHETFDIDDKNITCATNVAKISVVGAGMESHPGTASKMFEALYEHDINIDMISTSEIKISVLIDAQDADRAVAAVHKAFYPELN